MVKSATGPGTICPGYTAVTADNRSFAHRKIILKFYGNLELTKRHEPMYYLIINIFLPFKDIFHQISLKKVVTFASMNVI
jgi:hypothetical protein